MQITLSHAEAITLKVALDSYVRRTLAEMNEREIRNGRMKPGDAMPPIHPESQMGNARRIAGMLRDYQHGTHNPAINTKATVPA